MANDCIPIDELEIKPKKRGSFMSWFKGLMLGGLIGAGVAMLSTPRNGVENRQMLRERSIELRDKAAATVENTRQKANEMVRKGSDRAQDLKQKSQVVLDEQKQNVQSAVQGVKEGVRSYKKQNESSGRSTDTSADLGNPQTDNPSM